MPKSKWYRGHGKIVSEMGRTTSNGHTDMVSLVYIDIETHTQMTTKYHKSF